MWRAMVRAEGALRVRGFLGVLCALAACRVRAVAPARVAAPAPDVPVVRDAAPRWTSPSPGISWAQTEVDFDDKRDLLGTPVAGHRLAWAVVRLDLARVTLRVERSADATLGAVSAARGVLFAVDGGFFNPDMAPSGLLVLDGAQLAPVTQGGGSGVLRVDRGRADVVAREALADGGWVAQLAVQCGPRLVERGGVVGIHRDDGRRYARTAACVRDGGRTLDVVLAWEPAFPLTGPGLLRFAERLAAPSPVGDARGCEVALNLDGGPSTGAYVRESAAGAGFSHAALGPTPWLLTVRE